MWQDRKRALTEKGLLDPIFAIDIERHLSAALCSEMGAERYHYEPLLYERWLTSLGSLMDRALLYRREWRELDLAAVKAAMDYDRAKQMIAIEREIAELDASLLVLREGKRSQEAAAHGFATQGEEQAGFRALAEGRASELALQIDGAERRIALTDRRGETMRAYEETYHQRHQTPNNAHNFGQRANLVLALIEDDLREVYAKADAICEGISTAYGHRLPPAPPVEPDLIDPLLHWVRDAIRWFEWASQYEVEMVLEVPLVQPWIGGRRLVPTELWHKEIERIKAGMMSPIRLNFELDAAIFAGLQRPRLKAVGVAFGGEPTILSTGIDIKAAHDGYVRGRGWITLPRQPGRLLRTIYLGDITAYSGKRFATAAGDVVTNADPRGKWEVVIEPELMNSGALAATIATSFHTSPPSDMKLQLHIVAFVGPQEE